MSASRNLAAAGEAAADCLGVGPEDKALVLCNERERATPRSSSPPWSHALVTAPLETVGDGTIVFDDRTRWGAIDG